MTTKHAIVLYDGVCGLCDRFVQFVLKHDGKDFFRFASLQSEFAARILCDEGAAARQLETVYVVLNFAESDEQILSRSDAVAFVLKQIGGMWKVAAAAFGILPRRLRDATYDMIARHRYRLFGKFKSCFLPDRLQRHKFLDQF